MRKKTLLAFAAEIGGTYVPAKAKKAHNMTAHKKVATSSGNYDKPLSPEQIKVLNEAGFDLNNRGFNWEPRIGCFFAVSDDGSIWYKLVLNPNIHISNINHIGGEVQPLCLAEHLEEVASRFFKKYRALHRALSDLETC